MSPDAPAIIVVRDEPLDAAQLRDLVDRFFGDMVKLHTALINIRPAQGNRAMEVQDPDIRRSMREIVQKLVGKGEPL